MVLATAATLVAASTAPGPATIVCAGFDSNTRGLGNVAGPADGTKCNNPGGTVGITATYNADSKDNVKWTGSDVITRDGSGASTQVTCPDACGAAHHTTTDAQCYTWNWQGYSDNGNTPGFAVLNAVWKNGDQYSTLVCSAVCVGYDVVTC